MLTALGIAWRYTPEGGQRPTEWRETADRVVVNGRVWSGGVNRDACNLSVSRRDAEGWLTGADLPAGALARLPYRTWRSYLRRGAPLIQDSAFCNFQAAGWPVRCVTGGFMNTGRPAVSPTYGRLLGDAADRHGFVVQTDILWPELLLNASVFLVPWWGLVVGASLIPAAWRAIRTRPGRCRRCGYNIVGLTARCPECGSVIPADTP